MAYTVEQYNILTAAIAQGALSVEYADKKVTYRSLEDMRSIKREMEAFLSPSPNSRKGRRYASFSKGLNGPFSPEDSERKC